MSAVMKTKRILAAAIAVLGCDSSLTDQSPRLAKENSGETTAAGSDNALEASENQRASENQSARRDIVANAAAAAQWECPEYPVLFHHGFLANEKIGQFVGVKKYFAAKSCSVYLSQVAALQSAEFRAVQLAEEISDLLAQTGATKVHIIAHSQGGLDARAAITGQGLSDHVASLSTLSTPHRGAYLADLLFKEEQSLSRKAMSFFSNFIGNVLDRGDNSDYDAAIKSLTTKSLSEEFNSTYPDRPGVLYQSWAAKTEDETFGLGYLLILPRKLTAQKFGDNDGIVHVESAKWGFFRGILAANHFELVGARLPGTKKRFDHLAFLETLLGELQ